MKYKYLLFINISVLLIHACDHGIGPPPSRPPGISGTIYYKNWPPPDSLYDLRLVVFKEYPPGDIFNDWRNGNAVIYPPVTESNLPYYVDSTGYDVNLTPGIYEYIIVAQQHGPDFMSVDNWYVVGQYDTTLQDSLPTAITITNESVLSNVNIYVDFDSLPAQPF